MVSRFRFHTVALAAATAAGASALLSPASFADKLVLIEGVNGYAGVRDNTLFEASATTSNGSGDHLFAGQAADADLHRALVEFDLTGLPLPPDAVITGVELRLVTSKTRAATADRLVSTHLLTEDWGEGTEDAGGNEGGGAPATPGTATWTDNFFGTSIWATAGGDFIALASDTQTAGAVGAETVWTGAGMLADIEAWLANPGDNYGWILVGNETKSQTSVRFYSADNDEGATVDQLPRLTLIYDPGPMVLDVTEVRRNQTTTFTTSNAVPGARVYYLYSFAGAGSTFVPILDIPVDLKLPITNFGNSLANPNGESEFKPKVPGTAPLRSISFQSVHLQGGDLLGRKSNRVDTTIMP